MVKIIFALSLFMVGNSSYAQQETITPTAETTVSDTQTKSAPTAQVIKNWTVASVPWDAWFEKNTLVTDKTEAPWDYNPADSGTYVPYVHFFWNAQDFKVNFELKDKKNRLAEAAIELVKRLYPKTAKADLMKVDIVYVLERDNYGMPSWDSLIRVAHLEFSRTLALKLSKKKESLNVNLQKKLFTQFDMF
jgi:hypothetical protein